MDEQAELKRNLLREYVRGLGRYICRKEVSVKCDRGKIKQETQRKATALGNGEERKM